ncbi:unnamed protein product [Brassicogethes aeneus]|uniref:Uncharacterized protein n=1 Tax=Brassicogethes aeneus TaxID=1431903 RepID=A0A9P0FKC4_BRAAE|nr:unnamed protein product [Brassicogethes aeneus]
MEYAKERRKFNRNLFKPYLINKYPIYARQCTAYNTAVDEVPINKKVLRVLLNDAELKVKLAKENQRTLKNKKFGKISHHANSVKKRTSNQLKNSENIRHQSKRVFMNRMDLKEKINNKFQTFDSSRLNKNEQEDVFDYENFELTPVHIIPKRKLPVYSRTSYYYLNMPKMVECQEGMLNYDFNKLVKDVKTMKLPAPEWRIKIMVKKKAITGIVFTDKKELERCVTFSLKSANYKIMIDNKPVLLMGAPITINSVAELEVLLDIVASIPCDDQMLMYK